MAKERLSKFLARAGVASRRKAEELILEGRVFVNDNSVKTLGTLVDPEKDKIMVGQKVISLLPSFVYYLLNKPIGYTTTVSDPHADKTVLELVPKNKRLFPVGRLDRDTSGLLILTNDGDLTYKLTHPKFGKEKEYIVKVKKPIPEEKIQLLENGIELDDGLTAPTKVKIIDDKTYSITLREGRKRQIRRMFAHIDHPVLELKRIRLDFLEINDLVEGKFRELGKEEIERLKR